MSEFRVEGAPNEVLARLGELAELDARIEAARRRAGWRSALLIASMFGGMMLAGALTDAATQRFGEDGTLFGFLGGGALVIGLFVASVLSIGKWKRLTRADVENRRYEAVTGVLEPLLPELKASRGCRVELDLSPYEDHPGKSGVGFTQPWLKVQLTLRDGTTVQVTGTLNGKRKTKRKRKYTKVTDKLVERLQVSFRCSGTVDERVARTWVDKLCRDAPLNPVGARAAGGGLEVRFQTYPGRLVRGRGTYRDFDALLDAEKLLLALSIGHRALVASGR